jgi:methionyl-tRNA formyltransferase
MGTPTAAIPILSALREVADVSLVVTRPDKPQGRSKRRKAPPIKDAAAEWGIPIAQPTTGAELFDAVQAVSPHIAVVAAYGRLIKPELLEVPKHGFVNVHYSLLPRWRGASPVVRAILAGDDETGVSLMRMDRGLDTGPVIAAEVIPVEPVDDTGSLTDKLAAAGGALLTSALPRYLAGETTAVPQDDALATAAAKVSTDEAHIDPMRHPAEAVDRAVRAFNPKPGAWCLVDGARFKIWVATRSPGVTAKPGEARLIDGRVILGSRTGSLELIEVQPAGRPAMAAVAWMNGRRAESAELR